MKISVYFAIFLLFLNLVYAADYKQEFYLEDKEARVIININYEQETNFNFYLDLPNDVKEIKVYFDDQERQFQIEEAGLTNFVNIIGNAANVRVEYYSEHYIEKSSKNYFTAEVTPVINGNLEIKVILPEKASLDDFYDGVSSSIYPKPSKLESNGKNIIIIWQDKTTAYEPFALFLVYNITSFNIYVIIILFLIAALLYSSYYIIKKRKLKIKKIKTYDVEKHLIGDEKLIVNTLRKKGGKCTQSTLVTITGISKASLSRLLNQLGDRNIITKEQIGNKNLIVLKRR